MKLFINFCIGTQIRNILIVLRVLWIVFNGSFILAYFFIYTFAIIFFIILIVLWAIYDSIYFSNKLFRTWTKISIPHKSNFLRLHRHYKSHNRMLLNLFALFDKAKLTESSNAILLFVRVLHQSHNGMCYKINWLNLTN